MFIDKFDSFVAKQNKKKASALYLKFVQSLPRTKAIIEQKHTKRSSMLGTYNFLNPPLSISLEFERMAINMMNYISVRFLIRIFITKIHKSYKSSSILLLKAYTGFPLLFIYFCIFISHTRN